MCLCALVCKCVFVYHFILIMGHCFRSVLLWFLKISSRFLLYLRFRCIHASFCVHLIGCQPGSCGCLGVLLRIYLCVYGWKEAMSRCGPPARPRDSWGPLCQLRPTARSDSLIMGGLLLWFPNTHSDTCTHIYAHTNHPSPCGPIPGCCPTSPQRRPPALHRRGKWQYLISQLSCLSKEM